MKTGRIFIDRFSSIDHLTKRDLADDDVVMRALHSTPRVSTFEMSENIGVRNAIERLERAGKIIMDTESVGYPWIAIKFVDAPTEGKGTAPAVEP